MMLAAGIVIGMIIGATILMVIACCVAAGDFSRRLEKWSEEE